MTSKFINLRELHRHFVYVNNLSLIPVRTKFCVIKLTLLK